MGMIDRKNVIKALEHCKDNQYVNDCNECDYGGKTGTFCIRMIDDVLALLKEQQEAVEPKQVELYGKDEWLGLVCVCPDCRAEWMSDKADTHFCPKCGRSVK